MTYQYTFTVDYSDEDHAYIARCPDLPGCAADGETVEEALAAVLLIASEWAETARKEGWTIPGEVICEN